MSTDFYMKIKCTIAALSHTGKEMLSAHLNGGEYDTCADMNEGYQLSSVLDPIALPRTRRTFDERRPLMEDGF